MSELRLQSLARDPFRNSLIIGRVVLIVGEQPVALELAVPPSPLIFEDVLPILHGLADYVMDRCVLAVEAAGRPGFMSNGLRYLLSPARAGRLGRHALAAVVAAMPELQRARSPAALRSRAGGAARSWYFSRDQCRSGSYKRNG